MSARVAIVGAGPAGLYLMGALARRAPELGLDVFERLAMPFGLLRHGVASDHQGTKAVARQLSRPFDKGQARFFGRTELGREITLSDLRSRYTVVVVATGAPRDRRIALPGFDHPAVYSANQILRRLNDDPRANDLPDIGAAPVIIGAGNVALDMVRLLLKDADGLVGSDLGAVATDWLLSLPPKTVTLIARCAPKDARFDLSMIRELGDLPNCGVSIDPPLIQDDPKSEALRSIVGPGAPRLVMRFHRQPRAITATKDGQIVLNVDAPDGIERISATSIITAVGMEADEEIATPGVYRVGWCGGASGSLPEARAEALALCDIILNALPGLPTPLTEALPDPAWGWAEWRALDAEECASAPPDRVRRKIIDPVLQDGILARSKQRMDNS